jgi:hypothetical protein
MLEPTGGASNQPLDQVIDVMHQLKAAQHGWPSPGIIYPYAS